ncbi:MAG: penicillin acylase family protein [Nocardioidaceae bacterium]
MPRWLRVLRWVGVVVVLLLVAGVVASVWTVRRSFPQTDGTIELEGLTSSVTVLRDDQGIPQIYAETPDDLFFAQGYVQAQDRFYEMDFRRHLTAGRLAEMVGEDALETDMFVRTLGWRRVAEQELALLSPTTRQYLDSFSSGVNAYLADHDGGDISLEYAALGLGGLDYKPEEWSSVDSLAWLKAMAWDLGSNMADEVDRSLATADLDVSEIAALYPDYPHAQNRPIVNQGGIVDGVFEPDATGNSTREPRRPPPRYGARALDALSRAEQASRSLSELLGTTSGLGSNAWVVSGDLTASGAPILANDPHLGASMPGVWYQMGLHCTTVDSACPFDVTGFTFAGLPGVVIGHNARIAWGFTNLYPDTQDLYLEQVDDDGTYLYDGKRVPLETREETFGIAGEDSKTITVRTTRHGPLISDVSDDLSTVGANAPVGKRAPERGTDYAVALRWTALDPGRTAESLFALNKASNWDEFREAARTFEVPSQNMVYADVEGHIGYQAPGQIPIRRTGDGNWPVPGWDPAYDWSGDYIPFDALPNLFDPDSGVIVTANQAVIGEEYPYYIGDCYDYGYRAQRILGELTRMAEVGDLTPEDMLDLQLDNHSLLAEQLTPILLDINLPTDYYRGGQRVLRGWDYAMDADSVGAAYFNVVWRNLLELTFHDQLPEDTWPDGDSRWWTVMLEQLEDPYGPFWDNVETPNAESRDMILQDAMMTARDDLTQAQSRNPKDWEWGHLHRLNLRNETVGDDSSPVAFLFNRGDYKVGGGSSIVNAVAWDASEGFEATSVPSMRMVIPMDNLDAARWINLTGASGHAYNSHYTDQADLWVDGETLPWLFSRDAVEAAGGDELTLEPTGP